MVSLTGSVDTGKHIARTAADTLKRVHLELGGKAPVVVFDDVDSRPRSRRSPGTGYYNAGQDCTAATRVLAAGDVYDDVVAGLAEQAKGLVIGDTLSAETRRSGPSTRPTSASAWRASSSASPATRRSSRAGSAAERPGLLLRADGGRRACTRTTR